MLLEVSITCTLVYTYLHTSVHPGPLLEYLFKILW